MSRLRLFAALTLALAVTACGGSDDVSKEDYAKDVEKVCQDVEKEVRSIGRPSSTQEATEATEKLEGQLDGLISRLRGIEKPGGDDGKKADEFVNAFEGGVNQLKPALSDLQDAIANRDVSKIQEAGRKVQAVDTQEINSKAQAIGADGCGGG